MSCAFPKTSRLLSRADFQQAWRKGRKRHSPHFLIVIYQHHGEMTRFGITASRKTGNAVARNRIKRLVREYFRRHNELFSNGVDISVIAKGGAARLNYAEISCELGGFFHDEGLT